MPTGYTQGVIDGSVTTFEQFAKLCARAFGATLHMRDEPLTKEYELRVPRTMYQAEIERAEADLMQLHTMSNEEVVDSHMKRLRTDLEYCSERIREISSSLLRLNAFLQDAVRWEPPTPEHADLKAFMKEQLVSTIDHDGDYSFYTQRISDIEFELRNVSVEKIRASIIKEANDKIAYNRDLLQKEMQRCEKDNAWMQQLIDSLKETTK